MLRLYQNINEKQYSQNQSSSRYKTILFNLCLFHSILIERKRFQNVGWNENYDFSESDFEVKRVLIQINIYFIMTKLKRNVYVLGIGKHFILLSR